MCVCVCVSIYIYIYKLTKEQIKICLTKIK